MVKKYWEWEPVFEINPSKSALLVIDMQKCLLEKGSPLEVPMAREQIPNFKKIISYCRTQNIPVIHSKFVTGPNYNYSFYWEISKQRGLKVEEPYCNLRDGNEETKITPELEPISNEKVIKKYGYDCFAGTDLDEYLRNIGVTNLIFTGTVLNWCVDSTVRTAFHKSYDITVISDAVSSYDHAGATGEEWHRMELNFFAEAFGRVMSVDDLIMVIDQLKTK